MVQDQSNNEAIVHKRDGRFSVLSLYEVERWFAVIFFASVFQKAKSEL
jgi:hypothetical protein